MTAACGYIKLMMVPPGANKPLEISALHTRSAAQAAGRDRGGARPTVDNVQDFQQPVIDICTTDPIIIKHPGIKYDGTES